MRAESSRGSAAAAAAAAGDVLLGALAALVHVAPGRVNGACVADHFPLAQMLAAKLADAPDQGVDTDADLLEVRKMQLLSGEQPGLLLLHSCVLRWLLWCSQQLQPISLN
jgi:hypothetical protein